MKTISFKIFVLAAVVACIASCMGKGQPQQWQQEQWQQEAGEQPQDRQRRAVFAEQPKTVRAYAPEMNNMEMLNMTQMPGWQLLAGTQWMGASYTNSIKAVNENLNASFFFDTNRGYRQSQLAQQGTIDGKNVYLNVMTAADYLDYVFHRQFPNVQGAKRVRLKTLDMYSAEERQQLEKHRVDTYNAILQYNSQSAGGAYTHIRAQTVDRATADYKWVQDGDTIIHSMETLINATYTDFRSPQLNYSGVNWSQEWLMTGTVPVKNNKKMLKDIEEMFQSLKWNEQYIAMLNYIVMQGMQQTEADNRRVVNEMAQAEIRHQQRMSQMIRETNEYVSNVQREVFANQQASAERVSRGWRDAIVGVDRYMGTDGNVVEVPVSMGSKVWQSADGGTILTSDSYMFKPVDNLYDKDGRIQEFRQLQLLK
jgi:hypothetical protein